MTTRRAHYVTTRAVRELQNDPQLDIAVSRADALGKRAALLLKAGYLTPGFSREMTMDQIEKAVVTAEAKKREDDTLADISDFRLCLRFGEQL